MTFNPEITSGAIGIMITLIGMSITGISTVLIVYMRTQRNILTLQLQHAATETRFSTVEGKLDVIQENNRKQDLMLERISTRIELMGAISSLPTELASVMSRMIRSEKDKPE